MMVNFSISPASDTILTYQWNFGNLDGTSSVPNPSFVFDSAGIYTVSCVINGVTTITETGFINVSDCLNIPNVFSPNEDNINDFFEVKTNGINNYSFSVFTRSGTLVYKTESPTIIWDGRSLSGHKMKNGIYFYTIRPMDGGALNEAKGIVYLFE